MVKKSNNKPRMNFKMVLIINLLLVMLLAASLFIFMIILRSMNPDLPKLWKVSTYIFIVILTLVTFVTGTMIFLVLSKKKII